MATKTRLKSSSKIQSTFFLTGLVLLSIIVELYIIKEAKTSYSLAFVPFMWIPGFMALASSNYFGNNFRDLALIKPGRISLFLAYGIPAGCALLSLGIIGIADIGKFKWPEAGATRLLIFQPTLGVLVNVLLAIGEETGWRGYLHTHFMRARIPHPLLLIGLIWSAWHWPLILFSDFSTSHLPWMSLVLFTITMVSFSVILGWLREFSRSVFPCALAYGVHMTWLQNIVPGFYSPGKLDPYFAGQSGFIMAILYLVIAMYLYNNKIASSNY